MGSLSQYFLGGRSQEEKFECLTLADPSIHPPFIKERTDVWVNEYSPAGNNVYLEHNIFVYILFLFMFYLLFMASDMVFHLQK